MCAILGGIYPKLPYSKLNKALDTMQHRGPNASIFWAQDKFFLGHNRLSIVDVKHGTQPIWNEDKTIAVVVNGEFYDIDSKINTLKDLGHVFRTQSDSELLLHLYETEGSNAIHHLRGEFTFIVLDLNKGSIWAGRDRFGIRPLYWTQNNQGIIIASEAKALQTILPNQFNETTLGFVANYQYLPQGASWINTINILEPGYTLSTTGTLTTTQRYWDIPKELQPIQKSFISPVRELLDEAVRLRIPKEVKCCTHLSGGLDSSIITALAVKYGVQDSFIVSFPESQQYDESIQAELTAKMLGITLHKVPVTLKDILLNFESSVLASEGTVINGHGAAKYLLSKAISNKGFKVALTGEGSDEIFYGYSHLRSDVLGTKIEDPEVRGIHTPLHTQDIPSITSVFGFTPSWMAAKVELGLALQQLFKLPDRNYSHELVRPLLQYKDYSHGEIAANSWIKYCLGGYILRTLDDGMGMAHAVESRLPFLDHILVEWVKANISQASHFEQGLEKSVLRSNFKDLLHPDVYNLSKRPFMAPPLQMGLALGYDNLITDPILDSNIPYLDKAKVKVWLSQLKEKALRNIIVPSDEPILATLLSLCVLTRATR